MIQYYIHWWAEVLGTVVILLLVLYFIEYLTLKVLKNYEIT